MSRDLRKASREPWVSTADTLTLEQINAGSMLRMADATELMAQNHQKLINERDMYKRLYEQECDSAKRLTRQANALRGVIARMKREAKVAVPVPPSNDISDEPA